MDTYNFYKIKNETMESDNLTWDIPTYQNVEFEKTETDMTLFPMDPIPIVPQENERQSSLAPFMRTKKEPIPMPQTCYEIWVPMGNFMIKTIVTTSKDLFFWVVSLFGQDPVEFLHTLIPQVYSEINGRSLARMFFYGMSLYFGMCFKSILKDHIFVYMDEEFEAFGDEWYCPAFGNVDRCERTLNSANEGMGFLIFLMVIHYLACIQGSRLKKSTFCKITTFEMVLTFIEVVRWKQIFNGCFYYLNQTGAWDISIYDSEPVVQLMFYASVALVSISIVAFINWCDMVEKFEETKAGVENENNPFFTFLLPRN
jgi:hypothetical protein